MTSNKKKRPKRMQPLNENGHGKYTPNIGNIEH